MIIRKYRLGDENGIELTDVASKEWGDDSDKFALDCLHTYDSFTFIDGEYRTVACFIPLVDGSEYVYFIKDKRSSSILLKYMKKVLDARPCKVWSYSQPGQDKMHKFFGMVKTGFYGDLEIWEKWQRQ